MEEPGKTQREEEGLDLWSSPYPYPYPYPGLGFGFAVASIMVIATTGVLVSDLGFVVPAVALFGIGIYECQRQRNALPGAKSRGRELLTAIRDKGGKIAPAGAAMETSPTVREAEAMLSKLAAGGHLAVEPKKGALFCWLAGDSDPELEGRTER